MDLELGEHDVGSHIVGTEHQIAVGGCLYGHHHLGPILHEGSCRSDGRSNGLVALGVEEEVHIVGASCCHRTVEGRGRLHPIGNGVETGRELPCTAQRLSLFGRSALTVDGILAVRAYIGLDAPYGAIDSTTRLVGPAFQATLAYREGSVRHDVGIENLKLGSLGVDIVACIISISAYSHTHYQQLHK